MSIMPTRRRVETRRGLSFGQQFPPQLGHDAFHRAQADRDAVLGRQFLAHDVGTAAVLPEPLRQPVQQIRELVRLQRRAKGHLNLSGKIALHRHRAAADVSAIRHKPWPSRCSCRIAAASSGILIIPLRGRSKRGHSTISNIQ